MSKVIYHKHHIIPKHAGGTDDESNIAKLTVEEHAKAHKLLYEQYGRWQDKLAYQGLLGIISKQEIIRIKCSEAGKLGATITNSKDRKPRHYKPYKTDPEVTKQRISQLEILRKTHVMAAPKTYEFIYPNGTIEIVHNLKQFANGDTKLYKKLHKASQRDTPTKEGLIVKKFIPF